ncbi:stress protein DDR48-like [Teleopsis dalmanni]|uniref:stress protein DDR48-like n=1 Tax=Teleopsis dalmanni TaxID=139649 RepID=UPI0018CD0C1B|nr:stress protein DDR48-like [Teleopsis dalmanni]
MTSSSESSDVKTNTSKQGIKWKPTFIVSKTSDKPNNSKRPKNQNTENVHSEKPIIDANTKTLISKNKDTSVKDVTTEVDKEKFYLSECDSSSSSETKTREETKILNFFDLIDRKSDEKIDTTQKELTPKNNNDSTNLKRENSIIQKNKKESSQSLNKKPTENDSQSSQCSTNLLNTIPSQDEFTSISGLDRIFLSCNSLSSLDPQNEFTSKQNSDRIFFNCDSSSFLDPCEHTNTEISLYSTQNVEPKTSASKDSSAFSNPCEHTTTGKSFHSTQNVKAKASTSKDSLTFFDRCKYTNSKKSLYSTQNMGTKASTSKDSSSYLDPCTHTSTKKSLYSTQNICAKASTSKDSSSYPDPCTHTSTKRSLCCTQNVEAKAFTSKDSSAFFDPCEHTSTEKSIYSIQNMGAKTSTSKDSFHSAMGIPFFDNNNVNKDNVGLEEMCLKNKRKEEDVRNTHGNKIPVKITVYDTDENNMSSDLIEITRTHSFRNSNQINFTDTFPLSMCDFCCLDHIEITKEIINDSGEINKCKFCMKTPFSQSQEQVTAMVEIISDPPNEFSCDSLYSSDHPILLNVEDDNNTIEINSSSIPILVGYHQTNYSSISQEECPLHNTYANNDQSQCSAEHENILHKTYRWINNNVTERDILAFVLGAGLFLCLVIFVMII